MKGSGLIIEDDRPSASKKKTTAGANPFSFFSSSSSAPSSESGSAKKSSTSGKPPGAAARPPAPYSIFDEPATSSTSSTTKRSGGATPSLKTSGTRAPAPSIFDEPTGLMNRNPPPASKQRTTGGAAPPPPSVFEPSDDGFDMMKERLAEQEKLKRKVKAELGGGRAAGAEVPHVPTSAARASSAAEGGKQKKKENPFSFKNFASKGDDRLGDEEKDMSDDNDEEEESDVRSARPKDEEENTRPGENPFSFKAFAKKGAVIEDDEVGAKQRPSKNKPTVTPPLPSLSEDDDDTDEEVPPKRGSKKENPYSFSAFATTSATPSPSSSSSTSPATLRKPTSASPSLPLPAINDSEDEDDEDDDIGVPSLPTPLDAGLVEVPDFSADAGLSNSEERLRSQLAELQERLQRAEQMAEQERRRASAIERRALKAEKAHARLRKKEEEDTKQLNDVVQAIEHNLALATARAEKAEAKVQKLEEQLQRCSCGRGGVPGGDNSEARRQLQSINEQSIYLMSQLHKAANEAENGINQLMGGVATLRDIATVLMAIDKMSVLRE